MPSNFGTYIHRGTCSLSKFLLVFLLHGWKMKGTASMFGSLRLQQMRWSCGNIIPGFSRAASLPAACPGQQKHTEGSQKFAAAARIRCRGNPFQAHSFGKVYMFKAYVFKGAGDAPCKYKVLMHWYIGQQLMTGSHILENAWLTQADTNLSARNWLTDCNWLALRNTNRFDAGSQLSSNFQPWAGPVAFREMYRRLVLPPSLCVRI